MSSTQGKKRSARDVQPVNYSETSSRRLSKQVSDEKAAKKRALAEAEAEDQMAIDEVAALEKAARQKTHGRLSNPGAVYSQGPGVKNTGGKRRTAAVSSDDEGGTGGGYRRVVTYVRVPKSTEENPFEDDDADPRFTATMKEIDGDSGSGSDFQPAMGAGDDEDEDDEREGIELEDDEPDTVLEKKRKRHGGKRQGEKIAKPGAQHRARVRESRDDSDDVSDSTPTRPNEKLKKPKGTKGRDGLLGGWQKNNDVILRKPPPKASQQPESEEEGPTQQFGGLVNDDEDVNLERQALFKDTADLVKENTKIVPIESSSKVVKKPKNGTTPRSGGTSTRAQVRLLPQFGQGQWKTIKAQVINVIGGRPPWTALEDETIAEIWNRYTDDKCPVVTESDGSTEFRLWGHVRSLIYNQVIPTEWRFKLGDTAFKFVRAEWDLHGLKTEDDVREWTENMLAPDHLDRQSKLRPFIWGYCNALDWDGTDPSVTGIGGDIFLSRLVLQVFAVHLDIVGARIPQSEQTKRPYGALCMAIQAVNRALELSLSGKMCIPEKGDHAGHFSQENWGDFRMEKSEKGKVKHVLVRRATRFLATMEALDDDEWKEIIDAARSYTASGGKQDTNRRKIVKSIPDVEESDGEVIIDPKRAARRGTPRTPASHSGASLEASSSSAGAPSSDFP